MTPWLLLLLAIWLLTLVLAVVRWWWLREEAAEDWGRHLTDPRRPHAFYDQDELEDAPGVSVRRRR